MQNIFSNEQTDSHNGELLIMKHFIILKEMNQQYVKSSLWS